MGTSCKILTEILSELVSQAQEPVSLPKIAHLGSYKKKHEGANLVPQKTQHWILPDNIHRATFLSIATSNSIP